MAQNYNPFENIEIRFNQLESILLDIKHRPEYHQLTSNDPDRYIDQKQVSELLNVSAVSVWEWEKKGYLKSYRIGNLKRFLLSEVMASPKLINRTTKK